MEIETIFAIITFITTFIFGKITKQSKVPDRLIPFQNLIIGIIATIIEWIITKDLNIAIGLTGLLAGGTYDVIHNLEEIFNLNKKEE